MTYSGSCHCGAISFTVEGKMESAMECNCSHCQRKGYLLWFVPRDQLSYTLSGESLATYTFNKHEIKHHFCSTCGCAPFGFGTNNGVEMAAVNIRCLDDIDLDSVQRQPVDGRNM